jgi:hypothetical protein
MKIDENGVFDPAELPFRRNYKFPLSSVSRYFPVIPPLKSSFLNAFALIGSISKELPMPCHLQMQMDLTDHYHHGNGEINME